MGSVAEGVVGALADAARAGAATGAGLGAVVPVDRVGGATGAGGAACGGATGAGVAGPEPGHATTSVSVGIVPGGGRPVLMPRPRDA